uniref:Outer dynein arm-docking complex subunit 4 n=1 Tax=Periophthalmus magnuspinnatus TaxID=409849 RepID=A0A3B4A5F7_9GOBI
MSDTDLGNEADTTKSVLYTLVSDGDWMFQKGEYKKAIESYMKILSIKPEDRSCYVGISKCHLLMGNPELALREAENSLMGDKTYFEGLYQKAEALYYMGEFEFAKVCYHRGLKIRPEIQEFRVGIQKAQEAIENAAGSPSLVKLENKGDLSFFQKDDEKPQATVKKTKNEKKDKQVLGEFYTDKKYLEDLLKDEGKLMCGNAKASLKQAEELMKSVESWSPKDKSNRNEFLEILHRCIGDAHFKLGDLDKALEHYRKDLELVNKCKRHADRSRALDNMGRVHAQMGQLEQAIECQEKRIPLVHDAMERTWLFYELGRWYLELNRSEEALKYSLRSVTAAEDTRDVQWQMNSNVLVAQSEMKLGKYESSISHFEKALSHAKKQEDVSALNAIQEVMVEVLLFLNTVAE